MSENKDLEFQKAIETIKDKFRSIPYKECDNEKFLYELDDLLSEVQSAVTIAKARIRLNARVLFYNWKKEIEFELYESVENKLLILLKSEMPDINFEVLEKNSETGYLLLKYKDKSIYWRIQPSKIKWPCVKINVTTIDKNYTMISKSFRFAGSVIKFTSEYFRNIQ